MSRAAEDRVAALIAEENDPYTRSLGKAAVLCVRQSRMAAETTAAPRRGYVQGANYIRHIPFGDRTQCGRVRSAVNCIVLGEDEGVEDICRACRKLRVNLEADPVFGWQWTVHRGSQTICSGVTDTSNKKSVARREALAAAAVCESKVAS